MVDRGNVRYLCQGLGLLLAGLLGAVYLAMPAVAAGPTLGAQVFETHCVGCHVNGGNIVRRGKTLKLKALQRNHLNSPETIAALVIQGRGIMSAYGDRLTAEEIQAVAAYVFDRATADWK